MMSSDNWKLATKDNEISFELNGGMPVISRIEFKDTKGFGWTVCSPETPLPEGVELLGHERKVPWQFTGTSATDNKIVFTYKSDYPDLELISTWESTSLPGPIEHSITITNNNADKILLNPTPTISINLPNESRNTLEHWWVEKGAGYMSDEGVHINPIDPDYMKYMLSGTYSLEGMRREAIPWLCVHDPISKRGIYGGIEFSGWTQVMVRRLADGTISTSMGLYPRDGMAVCRILPGEKLDLPTCFIGAYTGEVEDGTHRLHRWVEKHLRPPMPDGITPVLVNNSWGSGMAVDEELAKTMIDDCADLGIELYHVDAGWYIDVGNWHSSPEKFPRGLSKTADYAHSKGLKFGLWVGWTQGGSLRDTGDEALSVFNPKQKNWFGNEYPQDWKNWDFSGATVCLGAKDAREWCLKELQRMVKNYKIDLLEHDQAMMLDHCHESNHNHYPLEPTDTTRASAEGYYWVYDELRKDNPQLLFENCVNGGRIVDYGIAKRTHYVCSTDVYDTLSLRRTFYDTSYTMPPSMIELYIEQLDSNPMNSIANFKFLIRSSMLGWCTIMIDMARWNPEQRAAAKEDFIIYKERLRPLIAEGNVYHILPRPDGKRWDGIEYYNPETGQGTLMIFRPQSDEESQTVTLRGLDASASYKFESTDGSVGAVTMSGADLMQKGININLPEPDSSDIIFFAKQ